MHSDSDGDTGTQMEEINSGNHSCSSSVPASTDSSNPDVEELSRIEHALDLNQQMERKLFQLERQLVIRLRECRVKLAEIQDSGHKSKKPEKSDYVQCSRPYFKDSNNCPPPDNSDTIRMRESGMYDFSCNIPKPGWTVKDKCEFVSFVHKISKDTQVKELNSTIADISIDTEIPNSEKIKLIDTIEAEISSVDKKPLKEVALPIDKDYNWDAITKKIGGRHSPQEYASLWKLYLHPSINKQLWSKKEHLKFEQIACSQNFLDWDKIAELLNTNRTGYQCFVYFRTNKSNNLSKTKWSKEEEEQLKKLIVNYREDNYIPWARVAACMDNRTKIQIYNKYLGLLECRKGRFLSEEDSVILTSVDKFGPNLKKMKELLPGRSQKQLRHRYQILTHKQVSTVWTVSEDKKLLQLMANQDSLTNFANITKYFKDKNRTIIRTRYLTLMKWMKQNPNVDIENAPRRGARRLCHGRAMTNLNVAVDKLKERMQSKEKPRKPKLLSQESTSEELDEGIIAAIITNEIRASEETENELACNRLAITDETINSHENLKARNLQKILILLKASINKEKFMQSKYSKIYPELLVPEQEVSMETVDSDSSKNEANKMKVSTQPNIWGDNKLKNTEYVLPPHFATITGCKVLLSHVAGKDLTTVDLSDEIKNQLFREQMELLVDRFKTLFVWPMLLSNEAPPKQLLKQNPNLGIIQPPQSPLPSTSNVDIQEIETTDEEKSACANKKKRSNKKK